MLLTSLQEESLIRKYYGLLFSIASRFYYKTSVTHKFDLEDYVQECVMVFLGHIRSVDSEEKVLPLPTRNMLHAMCVLALGEFPVTVPKRTTDFSRMLSTFRNEVSIDKLMESKAEPADEAPDTEWDIGDTASSDYADVDEMLSYEAFANRLKPEDRDILNAMTNSATMKEVAELFHMDKSTLSRKISRLRKKYLSECSAKNLLGGKTNGFYESAQK